MKDLPLENKLELVRDGLLNLTSLKMMNYALVNEAKETSKLSGDAHNFKFRSMEADRGINFDFCPPNDLHGDLLVIVVENIAEGGSFALGDYFVAHKREGKALTVRACRRPTEEFSNWLVEKLKLIDELFSDELQNMLTGRAWENVPLDWHGYK